MLTKSTFITRTYTSEAKFTADVNMYISQNYPAIRGFYYHIPNESATSDLMRLKLYAMGVLPGVLDFMFHKPCTWYMELKIPGKNLSKAQSKFIENMQTIRVTCVTCWTPAEVCLKLELFFGLPLYP